MIKKYGTANDWMVYHKSLGNGSGGDIVLKLNWRISDNADATSSSGSNTFITGKSATIGTVGHLRSIMDLMI